MIHHYDFLIIGGGVAGMSFALKVANSGPKGDCPWQADAAA